MTLLDRLRAETREGHLRVERDLDLLSDDLTADRYGRVVQVLHAFVARWEPAVELVLGAGFYAQRRKLPWLAQDLHSLGLPALRMAPALPVLATRAQALGSLYVLEGGTLGGQVILRHLHAIGVDVKGATTYFASYGRDVGRRWSEFRQVLLDASDPRLDTSIVRAASDTFGALSGLSAQVARPSPEAARRKVGAGEEVVASHG